MYNIMSNSKTGMMASQGKIDIISNNMVNAQTTGYKKLETGFLDLYTETLDRQSYPLNNKDAITGTGVKISQAFRNFQQGFLKATNIKTNIAIDGEGMFRVTTSDGQYAYSRNGEFDLDVNGNLVDSNGNKLDIEFRNGKNIDLSQGELSINKVGQVFLNNENIGKINLYTSDGSNDLIPSGDNLFIQRPGSNIYAIQNSNIMQGYTESSNVDMQKEMTDLIIAQRAFQFNSKGIKAVDEMWSMINNLQGR